MGNGAAPTHTLHEWHRQLALGMEVAGSADL